MFLLPQHLALIVDGHTRTSSANKNTANVQIQLKYHMVLVFDKITVVKIHSMICIGVPKYKKSVADVIVRKHEHRKSSSWNFLPFVV